MCVITCVYEKTTHQKLLSSPDTQTNIILSTVLSNCQLSSIFVFLHFFASLIFSALHRHINHVFIKLPVHTAAGRHCI